MSSSKVSVIVFCFVVLLCCSGWSRAHNDDFRLVNIQLKMPAIANPFVDKKKQTIQLTQAFLSTFSFRLYPCGEFKKQNVNDEVSFLGWLIPNALANHGVEFKEPTQIPVRSLDNLLKETNKAVGVFRIPVGKYCEMNYTLARSAQKTGEFSPVLAERYSFYFSGTVNKASHENQIAAHAKYAFGQNIPSPIEIKPTTQKNAKPLQLEIFVDVGGALKRLNFDLPKHQLARAFFLTLPQYVSVQLSNNLS